MAAPRLQKVFCFDNLAKLASQSFTDSIPFCLQVTNAGSRIVIAAPRTARRKNHLLTIIKTIVSVLCRNKQQQTFYIATIKVQHSSLNITTLYLVVITNVGLKRSLNHRQLMKYTTECCLILKQRTLNIGERIILRLVKAQFNQNGFV